MMNYHPPDQWSIFQDALVFLGCTSSSGVNKDVIPLQSMMDKIQRVFAMESLLPVLHLEVLKPLGGEELITQVHMAAPILQG